MKTASFFGIALLMFAGSAHADVCTPAPGEALCQGLTCKNAGETMLDSDKQNIIACLEINADHDLQWKSMTGPMESRPPITCRKSVTSAIIPNNRYTFAFTAAECGGTLPDSHYVGFIKSQLQCNGTIEHWVLNADDVAPSRQSCSAPKSEDAYISGPAVGAVFNVPCKWPAGWWPAPGAYAYFEVVYIPK